MKINRVYRRNEDQELDKLYKRIIRRENRVYMAEERHQINKKKSLFKNIRNIGKTEKEKSEFRQKYEKSWLYKEMQEIKHDTKQSFYSLEYYLHRFKYKAEDLYLFAKGHFFTFTACMLALVIVFIGTYVHANLSGYEVIFNGKNIGIVKNISDFEGALNKVDGNFEAWYENPGVFYEKSISYRKVPIKDNSKLLDENECVSKIYEADVPLFCNGAIITIDGKETVALASTDQAESVISGIGKSSSGENKKEKLLKDPEIKQKVDYKEKIVAIDSVEPIKTATRYLQGADTKLASSKKENPLKELNETTEKNGSKLVSALNFRKEDFSSGSNENVKPEITITTVKEVTYEEEVEFKTEYRDDADVYVGEERSTKDGKNGTKEVTAVNTYKNGEVTDSKIISEKVIKEPVNKVVSRGTKPLPPVSSTGKFLIPGDGQISALNKAGSHAGGRAVDIAGPVGTPVYASDSGVVSMASNYGGYGECVIINHGNGVTTLYGHNSRILVSVGQRVQQGEEIAKMGSTGNSTGPHIHFEIMINGSRQYLPTYFPYLRNGIRVRALQQ